MSKRRESTAFRNNAPGVTFCDVIELLVCYDTWKFNSKIIPELSSMERVCVVVYDLSCCTPFASNEAYRIVLQTS